ncbi:MAG: glycosyltransferase [archaeon]|nr:glycosyltransferase [archaeon]
MITIVIPAYNEEAVIEKAILHLNANVKLGEEFEILVINDGSADGTGKILEKIGKKVSRLRVLSHKKNRGFGEGIKSGIAAAKGRIIVTMDADMTHPPELVEKMVKQIDSGKDVCIASRYVRGGGMRNVPLWRVLLSIFTNLAFSAIFLTPTRDLTGGYKAYRANLVKKVKITRNDFSVQMEIIVDLLKRKARISEIPLVLSNRELGESKFNFGKNAPRYIRAVVDLFFYRWFSGLKK